MKALLLVIALSFFYSNDSRAVSFFDFFPCGGRLGKFTKTQKSSMTSSSSPVIKETQNYSGCPDSNWSVSHPKVYILFGYLEDQVIDYYTNFIRVNFEQELKKSNPNLQVIIIPKLAGISGNLQSDLLVNRLGATGYDAVEALRDPQTVGLIFIGHTFKTGSTQSSISIAGDMHPLPSELLSAATPAMRFIGILGCNGPGILRQNQVGYEYSKLPGRHVFYYNQDLNLSANFLGIDQLGRVLIQIRDDLIQNEKLDFSSPTPADSATPGVLRVKIRGLTARTEPRYVMVNNRIVGVLGSNEETSVKGAEFESFTFSVPRLALGEKKACDQVTIKSATTQPDAPVDNYLIESVELERVDSGIPSTQKKVYYPPIQLGLQHNRLYSKGLGSLIEGDSDEQQVQYRNYIIRSYKSAHLGDSDPSLWMNSPLRGRFYDECL